MLKGVIPLGKTPAKRNRVWEIQSQCEYNGKPIWTPEIVSEFVDLLRKEELDNGEPALKHWAWCLHDKDPYTEDDFLETERELLPAKLPEGNKPAHIHLALEFANARYNTALVKIIRENFFADFRIENIRPPKAKNMAFMAISAYLTHCRTEEQAKGKYRYPDDSVQCDFDYTTEVWKYLASKDQDAARLKKDRRFLADRLIDQIETAGLTIEEAKQECKSYKGFAYFLRNEKNFKAARMEYIKKHYKMKPRINIYIHGASGTGKSTLSKYLACALFPNLPEEEVVFAVGGQGVRFDDYDEQTTIIWEDVRAEILRKEYSAEGILNLMELNPKKRAYNIKFGKVTLTHQVNIFTCPDNHEDFFKDLLISPKDDLSQSSRLEDIEQVMRRFAIVINLGNTEIDILRNEKLFGTDRNIKSQFRQYSKILNVNITELNSLFAEDALQAAFDKITAPIVNLYNEYMEHMSAQNKWLEEEDAPVQVIEVYEGYQDVERINNLINRYTRYCKDFIDYFRLPNGEFGPYYLIDSWELGDKMEDEYSDAYYPISMEEWKYLGYPEQYDGPSPLSYIPTRVNANETVQGVEETLEIYRTEMASMCVEYYKRVNVATDNFISGVSLPALIEWIKAITEESPLPIRDIEDDIQEKDTWLSCWEKVKNACLTHGLIDRQEDWYGTFQKVLHDNFGK